MLGGACGDDFIFSVYCVPDGFTTKAASCAKMIPRNRDVKWHHILVSLESSRSGGLVGIRVSVTESSRVLVVVGQCLYGLFGSPS